MSAEVERLKESVYQLESQLEFHGFRRCDIPACNCGGYHNSRRDAQIDTLAVRLPALETLATAAIGVKHHRPGMDDGYIVIDISTWRAIVAALDVLDALDAAQEPAPGGGGAEGG